MAISVGVRVLWWFFFFLFLLNSLDILCGGLVNISLETVKYLCKSQRSQCEINEGCSARTMTNLFHLPAQQEEAAIPAKKGTHSMFFCFSGFQRPLRNTAEPSLFEGPDLEILFTPRIIYFFLFLSEKEGMDKVVW